MGSWNTATLFWRLESLVIRMQGSLCHLAFRHQFLHHFALWCECNWCLKYRNNIPMQHSICCLSWQSFKIPLRNMKCIVWQMFRLTGNLILCRIITSVSSYICCYEIRELLFKSGNFAGFGQKLLSVYMCWQYTSSSSCTPGSLGSKSEHETGR